MSLKPAIVLIFWGLAGRPLPAAQWWSATSESVVVHTDAGQGMAPRILAEARSFYFACARVRGLQSSMPDLKIVYLERESDFRRLRGEDYSKGIYHRSGAGAWILVHGGPDAIRRLRHELVHVMNDRAGFAMAPTWLNEGLAEYYSALDLSAVSKGRVPVASIENLARLASGQSFGQDDLANERAAADQGLFYARAWSLVRQLAAEGGDSGLSRFAGLLRDGIPEPQAFLSVYGTTGGEMIARARIGAGLRTAVGIWSDPAWPAAPAAAAQRVPNAEVESMFEKIRRSIGVPTLADRRREKELKDAGLGPDNESRPAMAQLRQGNLPAALQMMRRAAEAGTRDAVMWFEYAMLMRESGRAKQDWLEALRRAVALDPERAEAWFVLGVSSEGNESIDALHRAAHAPQAASWMWEAYGRALLRAGRKAEARTAAQHALKRASGAAEKSMAEGLLASLDEAPSEPGAPRPMVVTPGSWTGRAVRSSLAGRLIEVDCSASTPVLVIETTAGLLRVSVKRSNAIVADKSVEFTCGPQPARRSVLIGHDGQPDPSLKTAGDLVSIAGK